MPSVITSYSIHYTKLYDLRKRVLGNEIVLATCGSAFKNKGVQAVLDAAEALSVRASAYLGRFPQGHAFYHALGMSCNAYHGKLHTSLGHVDAFSYNFV